MTKTITLPILSIICAFLIATSFFLAATVPNVYACSCMAPGTPSQELESSAAVFSGKVTRITEFKEDMKKSIEFDVEKSWKGITDSSVTVSTTWDSAMCGFDFVLGQEYIVYTYRDVETNELSTNLCNRTALISDAQADVAELGAGEVISTNSDSEGAQDSRNQKTKNIIRWVLAGVILAFLGYKVIRSKKQDPVA